MEERLALGVGAFRHGHREEHVLEGPAIVKCGVATVFGQRLPGPRELDDEPELERAARVESGTWGSDAVIQSGIEVGRDGHGLMHPAEDWFDHCPLGRGAHGGDEEVDVEDLRRELDGWVRSFSKLPLELHQERVARLVWLRDEPGVEIIKVRLGPYRDPRRE